MGNFTSRFDFEESVVVGCVCCAPRGNDTNAETIAIAEAWRHARRIDDKNMNIRRLLWMARCGNRQAPGQRRYSSRCADCEHSSCGCSKPSEEVALEPLCGCVGSRARPEVLRRLQEAAHQPLQSDSVQSSARRKSSPGNKLASRNCTAVVCPRSPASRAFPRGGWSGPTPLSMSRRRFAPRTRCW